MEAAAPNLGIDEFGDWLSPMLVKELRQGMRSRFFVLSFLLLQVVMIFVVLVELTADSADGGTAFFWGVIGFAILFVIPLSGLGAVSNEMKANTLELTLVTRLTARRIMLGKWVALSAQAVLLICSVLPYAVLRYFLGGVNITRDLIALAWILLGSAVLTGVSVGLSPLQTRLTRIFCIFFGLWGVPIISVIMEANRVSVVSGPGVRSSLTLIISAVITIALFLEMGVSKIAPPAENHATSKRLLVWLLLLVIGIDGTGIAVPIFLVAFIVSMAALLEPAAAVKGVYRPFVRFGLLGRAAGRFLYPGWASGMLFAVATAVACCAISSWSGLHGSRAQLAFWFEVSVGSLLAPLCIIQPRFRASNRRTGIYLSIQLGLGLLTGMVAILASLTQFGLLLGAAVIPNCAAWTGVFSGIDFGNAATVRHYLVPSACTTVVATAFLLFHSRREWRRISEFESAAAAELKMEKRKPDAAAI